MIQSRGKKIKYIKPIIKGDKLIGTIDNLETLEIVVI